VSKRSTNADAIREEARISHIWKEIRGGDPMRIAAAGEG
jgi:hypothetical protein